MEDKRKRIADFIDQDEMDLQTHFVENPYIRVRERASRRELESKTQLTAADLQADEKEGATDLYYLKDQNKLVVKDLEQTEIDKVKAKELKRTRQEIFGYGKGEDISDSEDETMASGDAKRRAKKTDGSDAQNVN